MCADSDLSPARLGFTMPAEFAPHQGTLMVWPVRPGSWGRDPSPAREAFLRLYEEIAKSEHLYVLADPGHFAEAREATRRIRNLTVLRIATNDAWARDIGPTFVKNKDGRLMGIRWDFNAWGGLYADYREDALASSAFCRAIGAPVYDAGLVLEGGSIHTDGEGTALVTAACLLNPNRNPTLGRDAIERRLKDCLGLRKVLWLPYGIDGDETGGHVDNVCCFLRPAEVALAWTEDPSHPQYRLSRENLSFLEKSTDAMGRKIVVHKLPLPDHPVLVSREEALSFAYAEKEAVRETGERLPASYVNFYFTNRAVLVPEFGGENGESDRRAQAVLRGLCPEREVIGIPSHRFLLGGGNIHCLSQQIPEGFFGR